ncbi:MAG TPA: L-seryl-tRNA(Sec) selenium transferase [Candidatus Limnocylindria bacterium]|jgi:L-seryl-tRNA(Ser) seleniumtransferase|nr:L-seryl-tRNA(Sec) selenium transferase [Candidatus Limnocylindria bacterium]
MTRTDPRRALPSVDAVLRAGRPSDAERDRFTRAAREVLTRARGSRTRGDAAAFAAEARALLADRERRTLRRVLNATGVILQTNLGRAPLSPRAIAAMADAAGAVSVEYDLAAGKRGERHGHAARLLGELTRAEDAVVVNNNAAAVLLALAALATRKEVIVARGELVEIGGGFRIPDVLRRSGAKLVEVGTTNRTYARDYAGALTERTGAILRVHASNFKLSGFVARAEGRELAALAREHNVAFIHDLGSGTFLDTSRHGLGKELTVPEAVREGPDVVTFSGDKLLGGPQAGIAVGRAEQIGALRTHPLMRALRPDKITIAGLIATLETYRDGRAEDELPVWRMIAASATEISDRAEKLVRELGASGVGAEVMETQSTVGGGSLPEETQPSFAVAIGGAPAMRLAEALRGADPPVVARIVEERVALDLRSVLPEDDEVLARAVIGALAKGGGDGASRHQERSRSGARRPV